MKYIDADKIRTEIKRLKAENNCGTDEFIAAKDIAYDKVFDFLENLEEPVTDCHDLTEAAENPYVLNDVSHAAFEYERTRNDLDARSDNEVVRRAFIAGAEWQKRKMMEGAVEGEVCGRCYGRLNIRFVDGVYKYLEPKNISHIPADVSKYNIGDKVRIIILPKEEDNGRTLV